MSDMTTPELSSTDPLELEITVGNSLVIAVTAGALVWTVVLLAMGF